MYWPYIGWCFAGTTSGSICYCFSNLIGDQIPMESCSSICSGNRFITCGGLTGEFNVYSYLSFAGKSSNNVELKFSSRFD